MKAGPLPTGPEVTRYDYVDDAGKIVLVVTRHDHADGGKHFLQWTPADKPDMFYPAGMSKDRPLFHLPKLLEGTGRVAVVEGEKCVLSCEAAWPDQPVTCWSGGAKAWRRTDWEPLRGREVSLVADGYDPDSHTAFRELAHHLAADLGCTVKLAEPPLELDSDIADWLELLPDKSDVHWIVEELLEDYVPDEADAPAEGDNADDKPALNERMLARGFAEHPVCGDQWRYDEHAGIWRMWDGTRWEDGGLRVIDDVGQYMEDTYHSTGPDHGDSGLRRWQSRAAIMNVKDLARVYAAQEFDLDPALVGLPWNMVLDTRNAEESELTRDHFITKSLPDSIVKPQRQHKGTAEWVTFLRESLRHYQGEDHEQVYRFIQMWAATAVAGDCSAETMLYLLGPPNSGKGTVGEVLLALFGAYGHTLDVSRVVGEQMHHLQWKAQLLGKGFVYVDELKDRGPWRADVLNPIISGA